MVIQGGFYSQSRFITCIKAVHACVYPPIILLSIHSCVPTPPYTPLIVAMVTMGDEVTPAHNQGTGNIW